MVLGEGKKPSGEEVSFIADNYRSTERDQRQTSNSTENPPYWSLGTQYQFLQWLGFIFCPQNFGIILPALVAMLFCYYPSHGGV
jgi:hypothetical protein